MKPAADSRAELGPVTTEGDNCTMFIRNTYIANVRLL